VCTNIVENTDTMDHFRMEFITPQYKEFESEVSEKSFELRKIGSARTSLLVFAKGTIKEHTNETEIVIRLRPSISAFLFHTFWFGFVTVICILSFWFILSKDLKSWPFLLIPPIMIVLASRNISFKRESEELKKFLAILLEDENNSSLQVESVHN